MRMLVNGRHLIGYGLLILLTATGCSSQSLTAPTEPVAPAQTGAVSAAGTLTIRVLSRASELHIAGAAIVTTTARIATDATGVGTLVVTPGQEVDVEVSAAGYDTMGASAVVGAAERWTFYLPTLNQPAAN